MSKRIFAFIMAILIISVSLAACKKEETYEPIIPKEDEYSAFPKMTFDPSKPLYYIDTSVWTGEEKNAYYMVITALQGLTAREGNNCIYLTDGVGSDTQFWLDDLADNYGIMRQKIKSIDELVFKFKDYIADSGYIKYSLSEQNTDPQTNVATTVCAATGWLPIDMSIEHKATEWGLTLKEDLTVVETDEALHDGKDIQGWMKDYEWSFRKYKHLLNNKFLSHHMSRTVVFRDYLIAVRAFNFFNTLSEDVMFIDEVYKWAEDNVPIVGWVDEDENGYIQLNCENNKYHIGVDLCQNLTILSGIDTGPLAPKEQKKITPEQGKHYVAFVYTDGDNLQMWQTGMNKHPFWYGSQSRGNFPMTWGVSPNAPEFQPTVLKWLYDNATENDDFITGNSGNGYIQMDIYDQLEEYAAMVNPNLKRTGIGYTQLYSLRPPTTDQGYIDLLRPFHDLPDFKGGLYMSGDWYKQGAGRLIWINDKPTLSFRETLWEIGNNPSEDVAARINASPRDFTKVDSYTLVNVHIWSWSMKAVERFASSLDPNVQVITATQMMEMIKENVPHNGNVVQTPAPIILEEV